MTGPGRASDELTFWWRLAVGALVPVFRVLFRVRHLDVERVPTRGPAIVAANHVSMLDGIVLGLAVAGERRRMVRFLTAAEAFGWPVAGFFLRRFRQIPIRRGEGDSAALDEAVATIRAGALAGIFPEGRVNPDEGRTLQRGRTGVARLALGAGVPVVPAGMWGTQIRWPKRGLTFRRPLRPGLAVCFGEPVAPSGSPESTDDLAAFADRVMEAIAAQVQRAKEASAA